MKLFELKQEHATALGKADSVLSIAEKAGRKELSVLEQSLFDSHMKEANALANQIKTAESRNSLRSKPGPEGFFGSPALEEGGFAQPAASVIRSAEARQPEYAAALHAFFKTGGKAHGDELTAGADGTGGYYFPGSEQYTRQRSASGRPVAATYEGYEGGSGGSGGYAVSVPTDPQIVPLALPDLGIFDASTVVATATDVKIPQQASFGTSAIKSESTGTIATFGGTDPTLTQTALTAYMIGALRLVSWELLQDVKMWQEFVVDDLLKSQRIIEGQLLATGTGTGQPQGVFGNTGTGTGTPYSLSGGQLLQSLFDVTATVKSQYQQNAGWVMSRATGLSIRYAQMQANLYIPVVTTDPDGTERILGKPVYYDVNAPALPTSTNAGVASILYGDFKAGNLIGVRGGGGINVKILDQPYAAQGQVGVLAYRRLDSRVRRSEAIQAISFSHA